MRFNEMSYDQAADAISKAAEPAERIMCDAKFVEKLDALTRSKGAEQIGRSFGLYGILLNAEHKEDTFAMVAALNGITVDELRAKDAAEMKSDVAQTLTEIIGFFR